MARRTHRIEDWAWFEHPLTTAEVGEKGEMVCLDESNGLLRMGQVSLTLRPIGTLDNGDGTTTGDGTTKVRVKLFDQIRIHWFENDVATPVVAADIGGLAYILDAFTVSGDSTGRSVAGRVWSVNTSLGVLMSMVDDDIGLPTSFASGEYVPTLTLVTNLAAAVLVAARFVRINNTVTVYFGVTLDVTGAGAAELGISLPVASALAAAGDLTGHANSLTVDEDQAVVAADAGNDRAAMNYTGIATGVIAWAGSFSYRVL